MPREFSAPWQIRQIDGHISERGVAYITISLKDQPKQRKELSGALTIGRSEGCDVHVLDKRLSRQHLRIEPGDNAAWRVVDLESTNGTYVAGERVAMRDLEDGDEIEAGRARITFHLGAMRPQRPVAPSPRPSDSSIEPIRSASDTLLDTRLPMPRVAPREAVERANEAPKTPLAFQRPPATPKVADHHPPRIGRLRALWQRLRGG